MSTLTPPSVDFEISKDVSLQSAKFSVVAPLAISVNLMAQSTDGTSPSLAPEVSTVDKASNP